MVKTKERLHLEKFGYWVVPFKDAYDLLNMENDKIVLKRTQLQLFIFEPSR